MVFEWLKRAFERLRRRIEREKEQMMIRFARWAYRYLQEWLFVSRYSFASDLWPIHRTYYSVIVQAWVSQARQRREGPLIERAAKAFAVRCVAKFVGYDERDWWFDLTTKGEGWQLVTEYPALNWMECRIELEDGTVLYREGEQV